MHIDYDYYDYIGEQNDRNRPRKNQFLFWRFFFCLLIAVMLVFGIASLF